MREMQRERDIGSAVSGAKAATTSVCQPLLEHKDTAETVRDEIAETVRDKCEKIEPASLASCWSLTQ